MACYSSIESAIMTVDEFTNRGYLVGPCAVKDDKTKQCAQYVNNSTARFGGYYAKGLVAGEEYFVSIDWITVDESKSGTESKAFFHAEEEMMVMMCPH